MTSSILSFGPDSPGTIVKELDFTQVKQLSDWIRDSEDPIPTHDDVKKRAKGLFGSDALGSGIYLIDRQLQERKIDGPPVKEGRLMVPGYGLPVTHKVRRYGERAPFLFGLEQDWQAPTLTHREVWALGFVESITNKKDWWRKVLDPEISLKWKREMLEMPDPDRERRGGFSETMADAILTELVKKAEIYDDTGLIPVMDYGACVIKSDSLLDEGLRNALITAVAPLENVPESLQDWHPGSDGKVLDLVHPSLWPLVYGLSRIVPDKRIPLHDALNYCGSGLIIPKPERPDLRPPGSMYRNYSGNRAISDRFQWLPCDVDLTGDKPRIDSYINNLHPVRHADLYQVIEKFIERSLPAWDIVHQSPLGDFDIMRVESLDGIKYKCSTPGVCEGWCGPFRRPGRPHPDDANARDNYVEDERLDEEWFEQTHELIFPEPKTNVDDLVTLSVDDVKESGFFNDAKRIQVIVKLANIHLTPDKPSYDGGSWHVEGQYNEHITATALYYYDSENITDSYLSFRTAADRENLTSDFNHEQGEFEPIERIFDIKAWREKLQTIGSVLTRQSRALFFPNVYQHRVSPFELVDKTRPGHRKILALFLVDPQVPIISTANVPPQQQDWWMEKTGEVNALSALPSEIRQMVQKNVDFPINEQVAKEIRKELMEERTVIKKEADSRMARHEWSFCEH